MIKTARRTKGFRDASERAAYHALAACFGLTPHIEHASRACREGYAARLAGVDTAACPYRSGSEPFNDWFEGYRGASVAVASRHA